MRQRCPEGGELHGPEAAFCPEHICALEPDVSSASGAAGDDAGWPPARDGRGDEDECVAATCWNCGSPPANETNTECLNPDCRRSLTPPALFVVFEYGQVEVEPGGRAELGRQGPYGRLFRPYPNVSRRHAVVGVEPDGTAWIEPFATPNGTFVNGEEVEPVRRPLTAGDRVRLARDAEGTVRLPSNRQRSSR
ncbi:FHA domain-containing protein [Micromonospora fluostatini]|uniref:FHA domain-containing protein n=1 Tax=Micromonospora sp. JCM 30529 TaxID=3421643 RepID=UPI003D179250